MVVHGAEKRAPLNGNCLFIKSISGLRQLWIEGSIQARHSPFPLEEAFQLIAISLVRALCKLSTEP